MNARVSLIFAFVLVLIACTAVFPQTGASKTEITGAEVFDPFGLFGPPVGQILSPGTVLCPGYEPTGNPLQPCPTESLIHIRDLTFVSRVTSSDPRLIGWMTVKLNSNWDANSTGPTWGTFSLALDGGGTWDGTWQGIKSREGSIWVLPLHVSGQGTGGAVDGMHSLLVDRIVMFTPAPLAYTGTIEGRIVDPHAK